MRKYRPLDRQLLTRVSQHTLAFDSDVHGSSGGVLYCVDTILLKI